MSEEKDEVQRVFNEIAASGSAMMMIIRQEEMPAIAAMAAAGDAEARFRLASIRQTLPFIEAGLHCCLFCDKTTLPATLGAVVYVGRIISHGQEAIFSMVCTACDEPDPLKLKSKLMQRMNLRQVLHEAGHA